MLKTIALLLATLTIAGCDDQSGSAGQGAHAGEKDTRGGLDIVVPVHAEHPNWVDMGDIPVGEVREHVVKLRNGEGRPLVIQSVQAGCSCTAATFSYTAADGSVVQGDARSKGAVITLPADVVADLTLRVDSRTAPAKNVAKLVVVRVVTDSASEPYFTLDVRMRIDAPFLAVPSTLDFGRFAASGGGEGAIDIVPAGDRDRLLYGVKSATKGVEATLTPPEVGAGPAYKLRARIAPPVALGHFEASIVLGTSGPGASGDGVPFEIPVRGFAVADVELIPARFLVMRVAPDAPERGEGDLFVRLAGAKLAVTRHELTGDAADKLVASVTPLAPDEAGRSAQWRITIEARGELGDAALSGVLVLTTDDTQFPRIEVPWFRRGT